MTDKSNLDDFLGGYNAKMDQAIAAIPETVKWIAMVYLGFQEQGLDDEVCLRLTDSFVRGVFQPRGN